jgi:WD40 repeat protein
MRSADERLHLGPRLLAVAGLILLAGARAPAAQPADDRKARPARADLYGDPLPPGAVARLGTIRDCLVGPSGDIVLSPDGKTITATTEGWWSLPFRLWDVETGRVLLDLRELDPMSSYTHPRHAAFSPDSKLIAAGDGNGTVRIGRTDTGRKILEIPGRETVLSRDEDSYLPAESAAVADLAFLPDGKRLAVAYNNGAVWLFRIPTGERVRFFFAPGAKISSDGRVMAVRRRLNGTSVRELITGREISHRPRYIVPSRTRRPEGGAGALLFYGFPMNVAFSPDDRLLAFGGRGGLRLWDVPSGRESRWTLRLDPSRRRSTGIDIDDSWEFHIAFSPDGKLVAAEDDRKGLCLWSTATGRPYRRFPRLEIGHGIAFTPDGKRLISGGRYFQHWDIASGRELRRSPRLDEVQAVSFGPGGKTVAMADGRTVRLWDASTGREIRQFRGHQATLYAMAIAPDGKTIVAVDGYTVTTQPSGEFVVSEGGTLIVWDLNTSRELRRVSGLVVAREAPGAPREDWSPSVAFSPDGKTLVAGDEGGARIWNMATGREVRRIRGGRGSIRSISFSQDGQILAGVDDRGVAVWDVATGREKTSAPHREGSVVTFGPVGHTMATGDINGVVKIRDLDTGQVLGRFQEERPADPDRDAIGSIAFTPDGTIVATASEDGVVRLRDTIKGRILGRFAGHIGGVYAIAVSPDGKRLATAGEDGTVLLWDLTAIARQ